MFIYKALLCGVLGIIIYKKEILDFRGSLAATLIGISVAYFAGFTWLSLLLVFLILGYSSTKYKYSKKSLLSVAENNHGRRRATNVLANGLVPTFVAVLWYFNSNDAMNPLLIASYIAAVAAVTGDTLSSELGVLSKNNPYLITNFERVPTGTHGGVSPLGELVGIAGTLLIGISAWALGLADVKVALATAVAGGSVGFHVDSYLGAIFERKGIIGNATVNFLSTIAGALAGLCVVLFWI
jgi:uncharacterized protein (TIGR00297 family)